MSEYIVVTASNEQDLVRAVNVRLKDSWQLQGGISMMFIDDEIQGNRHRVYAQAMVRHMAGKS